MRNVKILGPGCNRCVATAEMVKAEADRLGIPVTIEKVTDYAAIAGYGVASTPGVVCSSVVGAADRSYHDRLGDPVEHSQELLGGDRATVKITGN